MKRLAYKAVIALTMLIAFHDALDVAPVRAANEEAAASNPRDEAEERSARETRMSGETGRRLSSAQESLDAQRYDEARATLSWLTSSRLNPYESARVDQMLAAIDQGEGRYASAQHHLENAVASGGLTGEEESAVRYQIAQLYLAQERWREGADALEAWLAVATDPQPAAYYLLAISYYQLENFDAAVDPAQRAVELAEEPQENWMQLLLALRIAREEYSLAVPVLQTLVEKFPDKKTYWLQLSSVNAALGNYADAAVALQLAETAGLLTDAQDVRRLTELLAHVGIPYRGGRLLAEAIEKKGDVQADERTYELLGNCWIAAREYTKALGPLQRAAELSDSGDLYVRLAQVQVQLEDWAKAGDALERAIVKGNLTNAANAELLLGIAYYSQKRLDQAEPWFERARNDDGYREQADGWLKQIALDRASRS